MYSFCLAHFIFYSQLQSVCEYVSMCTCYVNTSGLGFVFKCARCEKMCVNYRSFPLLRAKCCMSGLSYIRVFFIYLAISSLSLYTISYL